MRTLAMALLCSSVLAFQVLAADAKPSADAAKDVNGDKLPVGQFTGKLVNTPGSDGSFTVNVEIQYAEAGPNAARNEIREVQQAARDRRQIERLEADVAEARNPIDYRKRVARLAEE